MWPGVFLSWCFSDPLTITICTVTIAVKIQGARVPNPGFWNCQRIQISDDWPHSVLLKLQHSGIERWISYPQNNTTKTKTEFQTCFPPSMVSESFISWRHSAQQLLATNASREMITAISNAKGRWPISYDGYSGLRQARSQGWAARKQ